MVSFASRLYGFRRYLLKQTWFTSEFLPRLPRPIRWTLRKLYFLPADFADRIHGRTDPLTPKKSQIFTGAVDGFRPSGEQLVEMLRKYGGLTPRARVLDIGSGLGRLAVPLTRYLEPSGTYDGLDIVPSGIEWCDKAIASRYPNFRFTLADVYNKEYNPGGKLAAREYVFPFDDASFDLVVLVSVFTHMLPADMEHYLAEIARLLKPGGLCFATFFLINAESLIMMKTPGASVRFHHRPDGSWLLSPHVPELGVAYPEDDIRRLFHRHRLSTDNGVHYGGWCGREPLWSRESGLGDQDLVVGVKSL